MVIQISGSAIGGLAALVATTILLVLYMFRIKKLAFTTQNRCRDLEFDEAEVGHLPLTISTKREN